MDEGDFHSIGHRSLTCTRFDGNRATKSERLKVIGAVIAAVMGISGCAGQSPQSACTAPETLEAVRGILITRMARSMRVDLVRFGDAFDQMATIEVITFEGHDAETNTVQCRAQVRANETDVSLFEIEYSRQPSLDKDFVYFVDFNTQEAWNRAGMRLMAQAGASGR